MISIDVIWNGGYYLMAGAQLQGFNIYEAILNSVNTYISQII